MVLVTGGAGYIGSHTVVALQQKGFEVLIADNLSNSSEKTIDNIEKITHQRPLFERIDLSDYDATQKLFAKYDKIEAVINFAASKAVGESVEKPLQYYRNNLGLMMNVMQCMLAKGIPYFVQSSSCTVYGESKELPVKESSPVLPAASPYGNTKRVAEEILKDAAYAYSGFNVIALRYFNPIGAHESALIGELPLGVPNNLIPYITQTAAGIRDCVSVYGDDYDTPDGSAVRDYIHVVDLAQAHVVALDRMFKHQNKSSFEIFNIGTGNGFSVLEVLKKFEEVNHLKLCYKIVGRREGDIEKIWADTTLANNELRWKAEKSLSDMLTSAWKWQQSLKA